MICPTRSFQKINNNETSTDSMSPNQRAMMLYSLGGGGGGGGGGSAGKGGVQEVEAGEAGGAGAGANAG